MAKVKVGLALGGGGVRGSAHLGIVKALYENKIYPEIYAGTSAGSIVASLLAFGYSPDMALKEFENISNNMVDIAYGYMLKHVLSPLEIEGFIKGDILENQLDKMFKGSRISKVNPSLGIVATDINKGKQIVFSNATADLSKVNDDNVEWFSSSSLDVLLHEAVRASSSMPLAFIPKYIGDLKLVDGGLSNNLPSDIAKALGAEKVISVDLGSAHDVKTNGAFDIAIESINVFMARVIDENRENFGIYLNPEISDVSALQFERIQECYERGYKYGLSQIDNIVKYLEEV